MLAVEGVRDIANDDRDCASTEIDVEPKANQNIIADTIMEDSSHLPSPLLCPIDARPHLLLLRSLALITHPVYSAC